MKKLLICAMTALTVIASAAAVSAAGTDYMPNDNKVTTAAAEGYKTVLISKGGLTNDADIVYIGQTDKDAYTAATEFALKANPAEGEYTILLGGAGTQKKATFYIGMEITDTDFELTYAGKDTVTAGESAKYNIAYKGELVPLNKCKYVIIKTSSSSEYNGAYMGFELETQFTGEASADIGIQINGVANEADIESVWLSDRALTMENGGN